jgi:hypothetical protein
MSNQTKVIRVLAAGAAVIATLAGCDLASGQSSDGHSAPNPPTAPANGAGVSGNAGGGTAGGNGGGDQGGNGHGGNRANGGKGNASKASRPHDKGVPGIAVSPESIQLPCPGPDCAQPVTVRSTGTAPLTIYDLSVHNDSSTVIEGYHAIVPRECADTTLQPGQSCTFYVSWYVGNDQSDIFTANLLIFDNVSNQPTYVGLTRLTTGPIVGS